MLAIPYDVAALEAGPVPDAPEPRLPEPVAPRGAFAGQAIRDAAGSAAAAAARRRNCLRGIFMTLSLDAYETRQLSTDRGIESSDMRARQ